ncbi:MAG TPA: ABC transporter ATP-binding protein [Acidimicrobiales bacterium]|nr:ABC transporter ATP-binding protein [Acidimicrobiales bacterium]
MATDDEASRRAGWQLLFKAVKPYGRGVTLGVMAGLLWTAGKVAVPKLTQKAIDNAIVTSKQPLWFWAVMILIAGAIQGTFTGLRRYQAFGVSWRAETDLRQRLYAHLQRLHFAFHDKAQTGQLMARAATDIQQIQQFLTMIPITISNIVTILAITTILFLTNWKLAIVALVALPLINVFAKRFAREVHPASMNLQAELSDYATVVEESITGIRVVKGFGAEPIQYDALTTRAGRVFDRAIVLARIRARFNPVLDFLPAVGLVAVLGYGGWLVINNHLSIGELIAFNVYVTMLIGPLRMTGMLVAQAERAVASSQRIDEIMATAPAIVDRPKAAPLPAGSGEVVFDDVTFGYIAGAAPVLDGFSLHVQPGEAVAIVGATGSGKTTVARLIPRFYDVDAGRIALDGVDIRDLKVTELRKAIGIVFEDTFLFSDTIRGNIAFAEPHAPQDDVERAARLSGAHDFIMNFPEGYDTVIGERGFSLSGGQRQRLALARAILADPRVLILDDATSSVDPTKEHEIREALDEVMRGRTTIVIAHRPATIALADRVVLLEEGHVVAEGTHEGLLETSERYRAVLAQAEALEEELEEAAS